MKRLSDQLEQNPTLRIVLLGGLALIMMFMVYTRVLKGSAGEEAAEPAPATPAPAAGGGKAAPTGPDKGKANPFRGGSTAAKDGKAGAGERSKRAERSAAAGAAEEPAVAVPPVLEARDGLPASVANAYARGKGIVLLITQPNGVEDRLVRDGARLIERRAKRMKLFRVGVADISDYAAITRDIEVTRAPALVVVAPGQTKPPLKASVWHGFTDAGGMLQAVYDALYKGPRIPSYPD